MCFTRIHDKKSEMRAPKFIKIVVVPLFNGRCFGTKLKGIPPFALP